MRLTSITFVNPLKKTYNGFLSIRNSQRFFGAETIFDNSSIPKACTFAWFKATSAATVEGVNASATSVGVEASSFSDVTYQITVAYTGGALDDIELTDPSGNFWGINASNKLVSTDGMKPYGTFNITDNYSVTIKSSTGETLSAAELAQAKKDLQATGNTYNVTVTGGTNVRVSLHKTGDAKAEGTYTFAECFGGPGTTVGTNIQQTVTIGSLSFSTGEGVISSIVPAYYSVSGNASNTVPTGSELTDDQTEYTSNGGLIIGVVGDAS